MKGSRKEKNGTQLNTERTMKNVSHELCSSLESHEKGKVMVRHFRSLIKKRVNFTKPHCLW